jgi:hypothetical protein
MRFRASRLGPGDWLIGPASVALLVVLFAFPWFGVAANFAKVEGAMGAIVNANGWNTFTVIGPLTVIVAALGMLTWLLQALRSTPAPGILGTIVLAPFSLLLFVWLVCRVLIFPPQRDLGIGSHGNDIVGKPAAYVAVVLSLIVVIGVWMSLRREGVDPADAPRQIETFPLS